MTPHIMHTAGRKGKWREYTMYESAESNVALFPQYNSQGLGQRFFVRITFAFLAAAGAFACLAAITAIKTGQIADAYTQSLSVVICMVAAYHYFEIVKIRARGEVSVKTEFEVDLLRHADWVVTMPFLTLKFYSIIDDGWFYSIIDGGWFSNSSIAAGVSVLMIMLGSFVRLGLDELSGFRRISLWMKFVGLLCWGLSCGCLVLLLIDIGRASATHKDRDALLSLLSVWVGYPIVAAVPAVWRRLDDPDTPYDLRLSIVKDAAFGCLDLYAKCVFALWSASKVFGVFFIFKS